LFNYIITQFPHTEKSQEIIIVMIINIFLNNILIKAQHCLVHLYTDNSYNIYVNP